MKITLPRALVAMAMAVAFLTSASTTAASAAPDAGGMRWKTRTVCVQHYPSNDGAYWYGTSATDRMDALPNIRFVYRSPSRGRCEDAGYSQVIRVYEKNRLYADGTCDYRVYASTLIYDTPDGYTYDGYISRVTITLNDCWVRKTSKDSKRHVVMHELMHAIGPGHWDGYPSLVGNQSAGTLLYPTSVDKQRVYTWYA